VKKDLISIYELGREEIKEIFSKAFKLKKKQSQGIPHQSLGGKTLGMIFEKSSTRTRISFEVGMFQLGGHAIYLSSDATQLSRGETISDTGKVLSRYLDGIMIRTSSQKRVDELAVSSSIPVINGLTDFLHPCQILTDLFTVTEKRGSLHKLNFAYVGDGNNVANSWINAAIRLGFNLRLGCPEGYGPNRKILDAAASEATSKIGVFHDPLEAVKGADVINTDVWTSMGQEKEEKRRRKIFQKYQVNSKLLKLADKDVLVMHCLPAHRGEEITDEVIDGPHSIVFDQAENRLHVQKAILEGLMK